MGYDSNPSLSYAVRVQTSAVLVALIAGGAFISIPIPVSPVPIVLQNMFVVLAGLVLTPAWAGLAVLTYVLIGAAGLPVFAGATGGLAHLAGPTGGFLIGFPLSAAAASLVLGRSAVDGSFGSLPKWRLPAALVVGFAIVYAIGVPWLAAVADLTLPEAVAAGFLPFVPGDVLKGIALAILVRTVPDSLWRNFR